MVGKSRIGEAVELSATDVLLDLAVPLSRVELGKPSAKVRQFPGGKVAHAEGCSFATDCVSAAAAPGGGKSRRRYRMSRGKSREERTMVSISTISGWRWYTMRKGGRISSRRWG